MKPVNNYVLIELDKNNKEVMIGKLKTDINTSFGPSAHVPVFGTVVEVPILFYDKENINSMPWDCDMELKKGDKVYFDYLLAIQALGRQIDELSKDEDPRWREVDGKLQILIPYQHCFMAVRDEVICLNGYVMVAPIDSKLINSTYKSVTEGIVVYSGNPNREYRHGYIDSIVSPGDHVYMKRFANIWLEYPLHETVQAMYRVQAHRIRGKK